MARHPGATGGLDNYPHPGMADVAPWRQELLDGTTQETQALADSVIESQDQQLLADIHTTHKKVLSQKISEKANQAPFDELKDLTFEQQVEKINQWQISPDASKQQAYVRLIDESARQTAAIIDSDPMQSGSVAEAFNHMLTSSGERLSGAGKDISNFSTSQLLVIAGAAGGTRLLGYRSKWTIGSVAGIATIVQSPNLTNGSIALGKGLTRAATSAAVLPLKAGMRGTEILSRALSDNVLEVGQEQVGGLVNDAKDTLGYTLDGNYDPQQHPVVHEFMSAGSEIPAPKPLKPLLDYLQQLNSGEMTELPTRDELLAAGTFLKQAENLVSAEKFRELVDKRTSGQALTLAEKQQYILGKYTSAAKQAFINPATALEPQASVVRGAFEQANGSALSLTTALNLTPEQITKLDKEDFHLSEEDIASMHNKAESLFGAVNFENLLKHGGSGAAVTLYLAMMMFLPVARRIAGFLEEDPEKAKAAKKFEVIDDLDLNRKMGKVKVSHGRYKQLDKLVKKGDIAAVYTQLAKYNVLFNDPALKKELEEHSNEIDFKNNAEFSDFKKKVLPGSGTSRKELRDTFLTALLSRAEEENLVDLAGITKNSISKNNLHFQIRKLYKSVREGDDSKNFTVKTADGKEYPFTADRENTMNERLHDIAGFASARKLRDYVGKGFAFRYIEGGPTVKGDNAATKAVKFVVNKDGTVNLKQRKDGVLNPNPANWTWRDLGKVEQLS